MTGKQVWGEKIKLASIKKLADIEILSSVQRLIDVKRFEGIKKPTNAKQLIDKKSNSYLLKISILL